MKKETKGFGLHLGKHIQMFAEGGDPVDPKPTDPTPADPKPKGDQMIPKHRFDEVYGQMKSLKEKVDAFETEKAEAQRLEAERLEAEKVKNKEFEELYSSTKAELDKLQAQVDGATAKTNSYEETINGLVETKLASIDEKYHDLVPSNLTASEKLDWLNKAETSGLFGKKNVGPVGQPTPKIDNNQEPPKPLSGFDLIKQSLSGGK